MIGRELRSARIARRRPLSRLRRLTLRGGGRAGAGARGSGVLGQILGALAAIGVQHDEREDPGQKQRSAEQGQPARRTRLVRGEIVRGRLVLVVVAASVGRVEIVVTMTAHGPAYVALFRAKQVQATQALGFVWAKRGSARFVWGRAPKPVL